MTRFLRAVRWRTRGAEAGPLPLARTAGSGTRSRDEVAAECSANPGVDPVGRGSERARPMTFWRRRSRLPAVKLELS